MKFHFKISKEDLKIDSFFWHMHMLCKIMHWYYAFVILFVASYEVHIPDSWVYLGCLHSYTGPKSVICGVIYIHVWGRRCTVTLILVLSKGCECMDDIHFRPHVYSPGTFDGIICTVKIRARHFIQWWFEIDSLTLRELGAIAKIVWIFEFNLLKKLNYNM